MTRANTNTIRDRLASWRAGSAGFFKFLDDVQLQVPSANGGFEAFIPGPREREEIAKAIDGGFSTIVFCWPRRHGKTLTSAALIVWRFLTRPTQTIAVVANSEKQSVDTLFKTIKTMVEQTAHTAALVKSGAITVGVDKIEYPSMGSTITGYAASSAALYGKKLSVAAVSELHAARDDSVFQTLASSTIDTADGWTLVDSTVGSQSSPLYALAQVAERGEDPTLFYSHISYRDLEDACANAPKWIKPERLRSRAAQMLPAEFSQQHLNLWGSASNLLFPETVIDLCRDRYALDAKAVCEGRAHAVGGGLDRAYGFSLHGDATVTTAVLKVLNGEDEHFYVLASDAVAFSSAAGIKKNLTRYHREFGMARAALESFNAQDIGAWAAEQPFDHEIISATSERQAASFTFLYNAASEGRLHIHHSFEKLLGEMKTFEYELTSQGAKGTVPRFGHAKGCHDDHLYSLAWAVYALRECELNPYEIRGIHCHAVGPAPSMCVLNGGELVPMCAAECRSMLTAQRLYEQYQGKAGCALMAFPDFFAAKVTNTGTKVMRR